MALFFLVAFVSALGRATYMSGYEAAKQKDGCAEVYCAGEVADLGREAMAVISGCVKVARSKKEP